jgi:hypothetical protein
LLSLDFFINETLDHTGYFLHFSSSFKVDCSGKRLT